MDKIRHPEIRKKMWKHERYVRTSRPECSKVVLAQGEDEFREICQNTIRRGGV